MQNTGDETMLTRPMKWLLFSFCMATLAAMLPNSVLIPGYIQLSAGLGIELSQVNLLITWYTLSYSIGTLYFGLKADEWGRKNVLLFGLIAFFIGGSVPLWMPESFGLILIGRLLMGFGGAGILAMVLTLTAVHFRDMMVFAMGVISIVIAVADAIIPFVGGGLTASFGWKAPFYMYALACVAALLCLRFVPPVPRRQPQKLKAFVGGVFPVLSSPYVVVLFVTYFIFGYSYFGYTTQLPAYVYFQFGGGAWTTGVLLFVLGIGWIMASYAVGNRIAEKHLSSCLIGGCVLVGIPTLITLFPVGLPGMYILVFFWGIGAGLLIPAANTLLNRNIPEEVRASVATFFNGILLLGFSIGPLVYTWITEEWGFGISMLHGGVFALLPLVAWKMIKQPQVWSTELDGTKAFKPTGGIF
jgi:ACDE family multidrug resistance protein